MAQVRLNTPRIKGWRAYLVITVLDHFRVGINVTSTPFSGEEDSDISAWINLPWLEFGFGIENSPW